MNNAYTTCLPEMPREPQKFDRSEVFIAFRYKDMAKGILGLDVKAKILYLANLVKSEQI